ncbi:alpha/beta hydrolase [bacterium]|nr:alpha/beta hydrolase [bacterium]
MSRWIVAFVLLLACSPNVWAQAKKPKAERKESPRQMPNVANFKYAGESDRQVFDLWLAKSDGPTPLVVFIHGGGWMAGDKTNYRDRDIQPFLDQGISVASVSYRFILQAMDQQVVPPVKAPLHDAARAIQTIRSKSTEWNIDKTKVAATGSSAGACTSLWLAFHDDLADPQSEDQVARESTRLTAAAVIGAQTSLDPKELREWMPNAVYAGHAFGFAAKGLSRPEEFELLVKNREKVLPWIKEYSPIELLTKDDPPVYLAYPNQKTQPVVGQEGPDPTHSAIYGIKLEERANEVGSDVTLTYPGHESREFATIQEFLIAKLKGKKRE